ncbi:S26 family signal peptidase [Dactylosporangium sp. NPDC049742]|uniref:S26 family signal peptidase n=1 Tax=Dactylosporangium sp. NPDC049742 TaxID=3154737 RepID=UPI0034428280
MTWLPLAAAVLAALGAVWWLRRRYLTVTVDGPSMLPTYRPGERLLVRRIPPAALRSGQVVVFTASPPPPPAPQRPARIVKRVAAAPGDPIPRDTVPALRTVPGNHVPPGRVVLLGDNPVVSHDSRRSGYYPTTRLLGVVIRRLGAP